MDFSHLALTRQDCRTLEISRKEPVPKEQCERLLRYGLVEEERLHVPGSFGKPLGVCRATTLGIDYVVWLDAQNKKRRRETRRYWITTVIAIAALILSLAALLWQAYTWTCELHRSSGDFSSCAPVDSPSVEEPLESQAAQPE